MSEITNGMPTNASNGPLYLAFELSNAEWKLGFTPGAGQKPRERKIDAADREALQSEVKLAKQRFGLPESTRCGAVMKRGAMDFGSIAICRPRGLKTL